MESKMPIGKLRELVGHMPFNNILGLRVARTHRDGVTVEIPLSGDLRNSAGILHGGVTATIADAAVGIAITHHFGGRRPSTTVDLKINYFRPIADGKVVARSRLLRIGNHLVVGTVAITDAHGNAAGFAVVTYMLLDQQRNARQERSAKIKE